VEINITKFFDEAEPFEYSASMFERGANAGPETWASALEAATTREWPLLNHESEYEALRDWFAEFGAWEEEEIAAWSNAEIEALLIQLISGDIREMESLCGDDWEEYERLSEAGTCGGRMYRGDNGQIYFYVGS
jgi:hypothetical protein